MSLPRTVTAVLRDHVTFELECLDRLYLNVYQPHLQLERAEKAAEQGGQEQERPRGGASGPVHAPPRLASLPGRCLPRHVMLPVGDEQLRTYVHPRLISPRV
jgi:hypothetical protein